jgi:hypothetical protein
VEGLRKTTKRDRLMSRSRFELETYQIYQDLVLHPLVLRLYCFNAPCQFTRLNLRTLVFGVKPFGWLRSVTLSLCF